MIIHLLLTIVGYNKSKWRFNSKGVGLIGRVHIEFSYGSSVVESRDKEENIN